MSTEKMNIMENLFERILILVKTLEKNSQSAFAKKIGCQQSTFNGYLNEQGQTKIRKVLLDSILASYPQVSRYWLYFGEGDMFLSADARPQPNKPEQSRPKIFNTLGYYDDALGRIFVLTGIRTTSALELQTLFGAEFKEAQKFLARYTKARADREAWEADGEDEDSVPPAPEPIPDEWLQYFWTHFGPNPLWIQHGEREYGNTPMLRECPRSAPLERLTAALLEAQQECKELRAALAAVEQGEAAGGSKKATKPQTAPMPKSALGERPDADRG